MGQDQEAGGANKILEECVKEGKMIMLQNLHLMSKQFKRFENELKMVTQTAAPNVLFLWNPQRYLLYVSFQSLYLVEEDPSYWLVY